MPHQAETGVTQPLALRFADDGVVPNHPRWPLLLYRSAVELPAGKDPAAVIEALFASHGWGRSWRNGIFPFVHYHAQVHEVLGLARGHARVRFGGDEGETVDLTPGDIAVLPAGTGHQCLSKSADLLVVGAYPPGGEIDLRRSADDHDAALAAIARVPPPRSDPVRGDGGPLVAQWT